MSNKFDFIEKFVTAVKSHMSETMHPNNTRGSFIDRFVSEVESHTGKKIIVPEAEQLSPQQAAREKARQDAVYGSTDISNFTYQTLEEYDKELDRLNTEMGKAALPPVPNTGEPAQVWLADQMWKRSSGYNDLKAKYDSLAAERTLLDRATSVNNKYGNLSANADWAEMSKEVQEKQPLLDLSPQLPGPEGLGKYIVQNNDTTLPLGTLTYKSDKKEWEEYDYAKWMKPEERAAYNYLYNTQGYTAAEQYMEDILPILKKRYTVDEEWEYTEDYENASDLEKVGMNALTFVSKPIGDVVAAGSDISGALSGNYTPYGAAHSMQNYTDIIRSLTGQEISLEVLDAGGSETVAQLASTAYQSTMSAGDSVLGAVTLGKFYLPLAAAGASTRRAREMYEEGASGAQILVGSAASGAIEAAMEKVPLEKLMKMTGGTSGLKALFTNILKQAGTEGGEEALTEITNVAVDSFVRGANSDLSQLTAEYEAQGYTPEQARQMAARDTILDVLWAGIGGAISGGVSGGGASSVGLVQERVALTQLGKEYTQSREGMEQAIAIGLSNARSTAAYKTAAGMQQALQSGNTKSITAYEVGKLLRDSRTKQAQQARQIEDGVLKSAAQTGVNEDTADLVAAVAVRFGREIQFVEPGSAALTVKDQNGAVHTAAGRYMDGVVLLNAQRSAEELTGFLLKHELAHSIQETGEGQRLARVVQRMMGPAAWSTAVADMQKSRAALGTPLTPQQAAAEVVADWVGENLYRSGFAQAVASGDAKAGGAILRTLDKLRLALAGTKNSRQASQIAALERMFLQALESEAADSVDGDGVYELNENLGQQLQDWLSGGGKANGSYNGEYFDLGTTPSIFVKHGAKEHKLIMLPECVAKITGGKHSFSLGEIAKLPAQLNDPVLLFRGSLPNTFVALTEILDKQGNDAVAAVHIDKRQKRLIVNRIASLYSKTDSTGNNHISNYVKQQIEAGNLLDASTKKAPMWFTNRGLQLPKLVQTIIDANTTVSQNSFGVNTQFMQDDENYAPYSFGAEEIYREAMGEGRDNPSAAGGGTSLYTRETEGSIGSVQIVDLSNDGELSQRVEGLHGAERYKEIQRYILEVLSEQPIRFKDGREVIVDKRDALHIANKSGAEKTRQISKIKEVIENAELYAEDTNVVHDKFNYFCYYKTDVRYGDDVYPLYLNIGKGKVDGRYHLYDITKKIRDTAHRINGVGRPVGNALENGISNTFIPQEASGVNSQSMQDAENYAPYSFGAEEIYREAMGEERDNPSAAGGGTSLYTRETDEAPYSFGPVTEQNPVEVEEAADEGTENARQDADMELVRRIQQGELTAEEALQEIVALRQDAMETAVQRDKRTGNKAVSSGQTLDEVVAELGDEETFRRLYRISEGVELPSTITVDGQETDTDEYIREIQKGLPDDRDALHAIVRGWEEAEATEMARRVADGRSEEISFDDLPIRIQLLAAREKLEYTQLDAGEIGSKTRKFMEIRIPGRDAYTNPALIDELSGRGETYNPKSNEKLAKTALSRLADNAYRKKLYRRITRFDQRDLFNDEEMAVAQLMMLQAEKNGNFEEAADLRQGIARKLTAAGRSVQAAALLGRMTPDGTLRTVEALVRKQADRKLYSGAADDLDLVAAELGKRIRSLLEQKSQVKNATERELYGEMVRRISRNPYISAEEVYKILGRTITDLSSRKVQLGKFLKKSNREKAGRDDVQTILAERIALVVNNGDINDTKLRREFEKALKLPRLTETDVRQIVDGVNAINKAEDYSAEKEEKIEQLYTLVANKQVLTGIEQLTSLRKLFMLANLKTHIRNTASNIVAAGLRKVDDLTAYTIEKLFVRNPEQQTRALNWKRSRHGHAIMETVDESTRRAVMRMQRVGKYESGTISTLSKYRDHFKQEQALGRLLNKVDKLNSEWMEKEDVVFFRAAYKDALGQIMTARNQTELTDEMENEAMQRALYAVFRADNFLSKAGSKMKAMMESDKVGDKVIGQVADIVVPFTKTPANIAQQMVEYSPLGLVKATYDLVQMTRGKNSKQTADIVNEFARGTNGVLLTAVGVLLGYLGLIATGFGKTEKERAADELAGIQENSLRIGNVSITFDWLQPMSAPLIAGAVIGQGAAENEVGVDLILGAGKESLDAVLGLTMLQSLYDFFGGYDAGVANSAMSVAENLTSQLVPTVVGQFARAIDPVQRKPSGESIVTDVFGDNGFSKAIQQVMAKVPGLTYLLEPELDVWGDEVYRTGKASAGSAVLNAFQQVVSPSNIKIGTGDDDVSQMLLALYEDADDRASRAIPSAPSRDTAAELDVRYADLAETVGRVNRQAVEDLLADKVSYTVQETGANGRKRNVTKKWSAMTEDERLRVLSRIYTNTKQQVQETDDDYYVELLRRANNGT